MRTRALRRVTVRYRWERLKVSLWFTPVVMALGAVLLAWAMYWIDNLIPEVALQDSRFVLSGTVGDMRAALLSLATTVLATAGVVFTLLTLPLSTVAAQYGSRLLRVFLGDRTTQFVLGMFVATFVYSIAAALSIPSASVEIQAPQLTATVGLYLELATFASLILLVHHISTMLQAPNIAAAAGAELIEAVSAETTGEVTSGADLSQIGQDGLDTLMETESCPIHVRKAGYIQYIDPETMLTLAREQKLVIRLLSKPGHFVRRGVAVALVWPADRIDEQLERQICHAFQIGNVRSPTQDIEYAVNQLTEMAVRAMSPAINDPFTAMTCLDYLGEGLVRFIQQAERRTHFFDRDGRLIFVLEPVTFDDLLSAAFDMLRHASCDNGSVLLHMLEVIEVISAATKLPEARQKLLRHVSLVQAESQAGKLIDQDRHTIHLRIQALQTKWQSVP